MRVCSRRFMTLIEVLVASSLLVLLLTALFGGYYAMTVSRTKIQTIREETFKQRYVQNRLTQLFSNIPETWLYNRKSFFFTSDSVPGASKSLIFSLDNKVDLNPELTGYTYGHLYLNNGNQLCFETWPSKKTDDARVANLPLPTPKHEVLLDGVASLRYRFYAAPGGTAQSDVFDAPIFDEWNHDWPRKYYRFPTIVHIEVGMLASKKVYAYQFVLPYTKTDIVYRR